MNSSSAKRSDQKKILRFNGLLLVLLFTSFISVFGQQDDILLNKQATRTEIPPLRERLFFGGSLGLQFGTFTDIEVSPIVGLWLLPRVSIAAGPNFHYYKNPYYHTTIYGGRTYIQYIILEDFDKVIPLGIHVGLFLHLEDEALSLESEVFGDPYSNGRFMINTLLAGGGIRQPLGQRSSVNIMFLWALNNSEYGIYSNPEIRVSVVF